MSRSSSTQKWDPFIIRVNTKIVAGDSGFDNFKIQLDPQVSLKYRYKVDWGDGIVSASTTNSNLTHSYNPAHPTGIYDIKIYGRFDNYYALNSNEADKITDIISWGNVQWKRMYYPFYGCSNLTGMTTNPPNLETISNHNLTIPFQKNLHGVFYNCTNLDFDMGSWDTSNITLIDDLFRSATNFNNGGSPSISGWTTSACTQFTSVFYFATSFNQPLDGWDVSNTSPVGGGFSQLFRGATNFNNGGSPGINNWDTSNVNLMNNMFQNATNFNQPIGSWNVSGVTSMVSMFNTATNFNQDLSSWDVSNVNNMGNMFTSAINFNQDLSSWNVSNVNTITSMFQSATNFNNGGSPSISGWTFNTGLTNMSSMFSNASSFNQPIGSWDVSNVNLMNAMFSNASSFNQPIGSWNVSGVTKMTQMFASAINFNQDLGSWDVSNVTHNPFGDVGIRGMFESATNFNNGGSPSISGWTFNTGLTSMKNMFQSATNFNQPIGSWDVSNVTNMDQMFNNATNFNQDLSSWNVSGVTNMAQMFGGGTNFNNGGSPSISGWTFNTGLTSMVNMFFGATNFNQPIGSWNVSNVNIMSGMFLSATNFNQPIGSWDVSNVNTMNTMFQSATNFNQDLSSWNVSGVTNMSGMFLNSALDNANYNAILTGWTGWDGTGATKTLQTNVSFHAGTAKYFTGTTAEAARNYLTDPTTGLTWTITDGGGI